MADPYVVTLASSTPTSGWLSAASSQPVLELTGTGSVVVTIEYRCADGSTYAPNVVATDGGSPTVMDKISYNGGTQNGVRIALTAGQKVRANPGTVTGAVNAFFVER